MKAFTLVEMLVSIGILTILAGMVLFNQARAPQTYELLNAAQRLQAELRKTQGFAVATKNFPGQASPPTGGWGIHLDKTKVYPNNYYSIFGDKDNDGVFDLLDNEEIEKIYLPRPIDISLIDFGGSKDTLDIIYKPPLLSVLIDTCTSSCPNPYEAVITLHSLVGATKTVKVNAVGNIIIQ